MAEYYQPIVCPQCQLLTQLDIDPRWKKGDRIEMDCGRCSTVITCYVDPDKFIPIPLQKWNAKESAMIEAFTRLVGKRTEDANEAVGTSREVSDAAEALRKIGINAEVINTVGFTFRRIRLSVMTEQGDRLSSAFSDKDLDFMGELRIGFGEDPPEKDEPDEPKEK